MIVSPYSKTSEGGSVSEVIANTIIGASAGFTLWYVGGFGRSRGNSLDAALIAACTSRAAPSILRFKSNWMVTELPPSVLMEVISDTPEIWARRRSNGAARAEATVAGSAPGNDAETEMMG